jgi:SAM-dependent methyltransferase
VTAGPGTVQTGRFLAGCPADLAEWQHDPRLVGQGFAHAWRSRVAPGNGEVFFDALLRSHLRPDATVLDVGCGHGAYATNLARSCRQVIGVDADQRVLDLASDLAVERGVGNVDFRQLTLGGHDDLDLPAGSVDVFCCRRGPVLAKWLALALRLSRPGAVAVGMHPTGAAGAVPSWNADLPDPLRIRPVFGYDEVRSWVTQALAGAPDRVRLDGCWWLDVAEVFDEPAELYARLTRQGSDPSDPPMSYADAEPALTRLVRAQGGSVELRHCRLVWQVAIA